MTKLPEMTTARAMQLGRKWTRAEMARRAVAAGSIPRHLAVLFYEDYERAVDRCVTWPHDERSDALDKRRVK